MWYCDASFLVSAFGDDSRTSDALRWLRSSPETPLIVSRLTVLEFSTALRAAIQGGQLTEGKAKAAHHRLAQGMANGFLKRRELSPHQWFPLAQRITTHSTAPAICRALDVMHVAAAIILKQSGFLSFDHQQGELAKSEGLNVMP